MILTADSLRGVTTAPWRDKAPDVIATGYQTATLFEAQTPAAASWLSARCQAEIDNPHDQIRIDSADEAQMIQDLKAAGFKVLQQRI
jgi:hypothetical protein